MKKPIGVVIYGGTGYGAGELIRHLAAHPQAEVALVVSSSKAGEPISETHRFLTGLTELNFQAELDFSIFDSYEQGVIVTSLPHGASAKRVALLVEEADRRNLRVIDLSGDFRLKSLTEHQKHYGSDALDAELRARFVYGLPELNRAAIASSRYVSNPGCLATGVLLSAMALLRAGVSSPIVCDAKTGTSGAGRTPSEAFHHPECHANVFAYKVLEHRHEPEIRGVLSEAAGRDVELCFVPHVVPTSRGIYATVYGNLEQEILQEEADKVVAELYQDAPFVRLRKRPPRLVDVVGSNFVDLSITARGRTLVSISALDNLIKGMVGQAIENMNLMCGIDQRAGLWSPALGLL